MRLALALLITAFAGMYSPAAEPAVEIRIRSVEHMLGYAEYLGNLAGQKDTAKQLAEMVKAFGGDKGAIEGVSIRKPIGAYAVLSPGLVDSQVIVMLPVSDEKEFAKMLEKRLNITPKLEKNDTYRLEVPKVPVPVFFRMHKDYACFTIMDAERLKPENLLDPSEFLKFKDDSLVSIDLHIDRIPDEFRKVFLSQMELSLADGTAKMKNGTAAEKLGYMLGYDGTMKAIKCLMEECKTVSLKLEIQPKTDDLSLTLSATPITGSEFAKTLQELPKRPAHAALAANAENPVASLAMKMGLPESMRKDFGLKMDEAINEIIQNSGGDKMALERLMETLTPMLRGGDYELGLAITGSPADGKLRLMAAVKMIEGKELEKLIKEFAVFIPEDQAKIEFDAAKLEMGNLHKFTVKNADLKKLYGGETVWAAFGDSLHVISFEPDAAALKKFAELKPGTTDLLAARISITRFMKLVDPALADLDMKPILKEVFGDAVAPGSDEAKLTITGGSALTIKLNVKGKGLSFLVQMTQAKEMK